MGRGSDTANDVLAIAYNILPSTLVPFPIKIVLPKRFVAIRDMDTRPNKIVQDRIIVNTKQ